MVVQSIAINLRMCSFNMHQNSNCDKKNTFYVNLPFTLYILLLEHLERRRFDSFVPSSSKFVLTHTKIPFYF